MRKHEYTELWTRIARPTRVRRIPDRTVVIHVHTGARMTSGTSDHFRAMRDTYGYIESTLDQRSPIPRTVLQRKWTEIYLGFLECAFTDRELPFVDLIHEGYVRTGGRIIHARRFWRALWARITRSH